MNWFTLNIRIKLSKFHIQYMIRMVIYVNTCIYIHIIHILHTYSIHHLVYHLKQLGYTGLYPGKNHIQTRMHMDFPTGYVSKPRYPNESIPWSELPCPNIPQPFAGWISVKHIQYPLVLLKSRISAGWIPAVVARQFQKNLAPAAEYPT